MGSFARVRTHTADLAGRISRPPRCPSSAATSPAKMSTRSPLRDAIVVIGSEGRGLSPAVRKFVTQCITIPRYGAASGRAGGGAESLNAAIAAAIVCDNLRRLSG
jgi:TrmH family RNA methyltransferase